MRLCFHLFAPPQDVGEIGKGFREVAAGLTLHAERNHKEPEFRRVDALCSFPKQAFEVAPHAHTALD